MGKIYEFKTNIDDDVVFAKLSEIQLVMTGTAKPELPSEFQDSLIGEIARRVVDEKMKEEARVLIRLKSGKKFSIKCKNVDHMNQLAKRIKKAVRNECDVHTFDTSMIVQEDEPKEPAADKDIQHPKDEKSVQNAACDVKEQETEEE